MQPTQLQMQTLASESIRYLLVGVWNTLFGYGVMVGLFYLLIPYLSLIVVTVIANICGITMSFVTYKLLVFCTPGNWLKEYFKSYIVYGGAACFNIFLIWGLSGKLGLSIWFAQGVAIPLGVVSSYFGHKYLTFRKSRIG